jgi:hypothetical protein
MHYKQAREMWTPTDNVLPFPKRTPCAQVNEDAADQLLRGMTDCELAVHVDALDREHKIKRDALQTAATSLARALHERWRRNIER